ncbi:type IV secretory system conjugative DNA transfer family protein [Rhizobium leguminosarum]|uniref:Type IV secretory system conjugative DNA transfer family protein n=1 Tax=Rhizobium beringeri TaxID=3019934 RepID=A0ABY1XHL3_9HYPH|nr:MULTISPECIES: type IV secretory system conjugative DNA transfer family protein [Rhizobium]TBC53776.1 type IV secretory system conjugative DNA transfer family protein [Rhizobium leguminosarum]TBE57585.1 type IV secretory system conjugative DNA transfer family protein [Rhizobium beringeri]
MQIILLACRLLVFLTFGVLRLLLALLLLMMQTPRQTSTTYGSARWATFRELVFGRVWGGDGLIVGRKWGRFLRFNRDGYVLLFAPTRSGKGVGVVVPNLLDYKGSIICSDPKGENSAITRRHRSTLGPAVTLNVIDPHLSDSFNPLDMVRIGTFHEADDALELAKLLVIPDSASGGHWDNRATQLLQGLILYTCLRYRDVPELRNLSKIRSLVATGFSGISSVIAEDARHLGSTTLREFMQAFQEMEASEEARSIMSNADKAMAIWSADRPAGLVSMSSGFDFRDFNRQVMTCYVIVDEEKLPIYGGFLRVMMGCALTAMTRAKDEAPPRHPTLLLLDEAAAMGRIEPLETGVGYLASYARLILVFQDLNQLRRTYPKADSMIANANCKVAFGVNDVASARDLADAIGKTTVTNRDGTEVSRYLLDPAEITRLSSKKSIIFFSGAVKFPVLARKVRYFKIRRWRRRWDRWRRQSAHIIPFGRPPSRTEAA